METPVLVVRGEGEVIGDTPARRVEILSDHETLAATWPRFGQRREGAALHVHRHHTDVFDELVSELTLRLEVDDAQVAVPAGTLVRIPPHVVHGFRNAGDGELCFLDVHAPGMGFADYLRSGRDGKPFAFDQRAAVRAAFDQEPAGTP